MEKPLEIRSRTKVSTPRESENFEDLEFQMETERGLLSKPKVEPK